MALDFTTVVHVRHQFGNVDQNVGVYAGLDKRWNFDCSEVSSEHALLFFQSSGVEQEQSIEINGVAVPGGVPVNEVVVGGTGGPLGNVPFHTHSVVGSFSGWAGNIMVIGRGVLKSQANDLRISSSGAEFVIDNVVVVFKTRRDPGLLHRVAGQLAHVARRSQSRVQRRAGSSSR